MKAEQLKRIVNAIDDDTWVGFEVRCLEDIINMAKKHLEVGNKRLPISLTEFDIDSIGEDEDECAILSFKIK